MIAVSCRKREGTADRTSVTNSYLLPDMYLPLAPCRRLFSNYSAFSLQRAHELARACPEKRGTFSHALRDAEGRDVGLSDNSVTIECHVDGRDVPLNLQDDLFAIGFEPDGFATYNPLHFNCHQSLKFVVASSLYERRRELFEFARVAAVTAHRLLNNAGVEAYVELETYPSTNRRYWVPRSPGSGWQTAYPLQSAHLKARRVDCVPERGEVCGPKKRADVHIKFRRESQCAGAANDIVEQLRQSGFYVVTTWASNDICTAEFANARDAEFVYDKLDTFFTEWGGPLEMTLECVVGQWRTTYLLNGELTLASLPPLIESISAEDYGVG